MEIINEAILDKTHNGLNIYAHVLRQYYPGTTVLSLSGRDCQPTKNPYNDNKPTLKIQIVNNCAEHYDLEGSINKGNAFDFAALHYNLKAQALNEKLNEELFLRIGKQSGFCRDEITVPAQEEPQPGKIAFPFFSYFKSPVTNTIPKKDINLLQVYQLLKSKEFGDCTNKLRSISEKQDARKYKAAQFDYVTFSGSFSKRNDKSLLRHSGLIAVDFDHIDNTAELKIKLLQDEYFETELLFVSPSGDGLKWIIPIDLTKANQQVYFKGVSNYIKHTYHIDVDQSGKDVSRACFLPQDTAPFINPKYL